MTITMMSKTRRTATGSTISQRLVIHLLLTTVGILLCWWRSPGVLGEEIVSSSTDHGSSNDADEDPATSEAENDENTVVSRIDELREQTYLDFYEDEDLDLSGDPVEVASTVMTRLGANLEERLATLFTKATSAHCRAKIAEHMAYFINAFGLEENLPFSNVRFANECGETVHYDWNNLPEGMHVGDIQNRTYQPPRNESVYMEAADMHLCYAIMAHDDPRATIRLMEALQEEDNRHVFIVHVDGKEIYDPTQAQLKHYATTRPNIHVLDNGYRVRVNWGGFSMVNATMQMLRYAYSLDDPTRPLLYFDKFVHLASSSYPLASNSEIRHRLASFPLDANFLNIILQPAQPSLDVWHYFVECDDSLHRIYQLLPLKASWAGLDLYTSSQWFIISRDFAWYLALAQPGSLVAEYLKYVEHVVVADETFFGTVLRHTHFCKKHHNRNFLHLQFDRWESDLPADKRDPRKCPMPDPDHCGRSPTLMTVDYADILELSDNLFARKFDDSVDSRVKDIIDTWRDKREKAIQDGADPNSVVAMNNMEFEGHGVLIVAKDTVKDTMPLCLGLGESGNNLRLTPCFENWVPPTLADEWETGGVIVQETVPLTRWHIGPCTSDGKLERLPSATMQVTLGNYSETGPRCMLKQMDGFRAGRCYDCQSDSLQPGGSTHVYPCTSEWYQFVSFGDGRLAPSGSLYSTIPSHIVRQINKLGHEQIEHMCLGVYDRGDRDEIDWYDSDYQEQIAQGKIVTRPPSDPNQEWGALSEWSGSEVVTTQCNNIGAVIEWLFVPFIVESQEGEQNVVSDEPRDEL